MSDDKEKFELKAEENKGTGFFGKWAYYAQKKKEWEKSRDNE